MFNKYFKKIVTSTLITLVAFGTIQTTVSNNVKNQTVFATDITFVINASSFSGLTTSTPAETIGNVSVNSIDIDLGIKNATVSTTINLTQNTSALYNINPLPGTIKSIVITQKTGQSNTLHIGNTSRIINSVSGSIAVQTGTSLASTTVSSTSQTFDNSNLSVISTYSDLSYFAFIPTGGNQTQIESISFSMTVSNVVASNGGAYSLAVDLLLQTENKEGLCNATDLNWSSLQTQYNDMTGDEKTAFRTDTTDEQIVSARDRYIYLRSIDPTLANFATL